jgi:restriction endonuclease S subunit
MTFRDKAPVHNAGGNAHSLTIKDIVSKGPLNFAELPQIDVDKSQLTNQLQPGDVLLPGRGDNYVARHFSGCPRPVFPIGQINVLRPSGELNSEYLTWYLNQDEAQRFIEQSLGGASTKALSKTRLLEMPIPLPSLRVQEKIAYLQSMQTERSKLLFELHDLNQRQVDTACSRLLDLK